MTEALRKTVLFSGYAPVHFLCFQPAYELLRSDPRLEFWFSGGFRRKSKGAVEYDLTGFYDSHPVPRDRILSVEETRERDFDVLVCSHTSADLFPRAVGQSVQIFHGVSFKNYMVRDKALAFGYLCLPGVYHATQYRDNGLIREDGPRVLVTGFAKTDCLIDGTLDKRAVLQAIGVDPARPTVLYAPTGDKFNSLETMGEKIIATIAEADRWNLLIKLHDHPKRRKIDWVERLARYESKRVRIVRDHDLMPYLNAADLLLSDASSAATEFTLTGRPVVLLSVPQLVEGIGGRGGSADLNLCARLGPTVAKPNAVVDAIARELARPARYSALRRGIAEEVFYAPGSAAKRVAGVIRYAAGIAESLPADIIRLEPARNEEAAIGAADAAA